VNTNTKASLAHLSDTAILEMYREAEHDYFLASATQRGGEWQQVCFIGMMNLFIESHNRNLNLIEEK
jgi:hypothetical protein